MTDRILFVDDDRRILQGLRRTLRGMRGKWDMSFAESGMDALRMLEKQPAHVVVSDMRMPGMDGAQLLSEVRKRHPGTIRIILSGHANEESVRRTVDPAHQYLAKPCDSEVLVDTIQCALGLRRLLGNKDLQSLVAGLKNLPSPPATYFKVVEELRSDHSSVDSVARIIAQDVAMTAEILKLTNSSYFGLSGRVTTAKHAVQVLGMETVQALVLKIGLFRQFKGGTEFTSVIRTLNNRGLETAVAARTIAKLEKLDRVVADQAFCAGMLSDIGVLVLIDNRQGGYRKVMDLVKTNGANPVLAERRVFGASHAELGAYLAGLWGYSDSVVEAIAYHHGPGKCACREVSALTAVHVAQALIGDWRPATVGNDPEARLDKPYLTKIGVAGRMKAWKKAIGTR